jgi:hypothetical protein
MKATGIYVHLTHIHLPDLGASYRVPKPGDEPMLAVIYDSMKWILEYTMSILVHDQNVEARRLSRRNAQLLNTFTRGKTSADPLQALQNA